MTHYVTHRDITHPELERISLKTAIDTLLLPFNNTLAYDIETTGLKWYEGNIVTVQFATEDFSVVIDMYGIDLEELLEVFEEKVLLGHNLKFDLIWGYQYGIFPKKIKDTFIQETLLTNGKLNKKTLVACVEKYTDYTDKIDKSIRIGLNGDSFRYLNFVQYAATDVEILFEIDKKQRELAKKMNMLDAFNLENNFVPVLAYIEFSGMRLNKDKWLDKIGLDLYKTYTQLDKLNSYLEDTEDERFIEYVLQGGIKKYPILNWNSPKQVLEYFQSIGAFPTGKDPKTKVIKPTVNASALKPFFAKFPIIQDYVLYKEHKKVVSAYGENFLLFTSKNPDGRLRTGFRQIMHTGRMSSGNPVNFQNIPRPYEVKDVMHSTERLCFEPEEGNTFLVADYSQQEQVIMANKSKDPGLLEFFRSGGGDMHSFIAKLMYPELKDLSLADIKRDHKEVRQEAKAVGFAINYGGSAQTIADNLGISLDDAQEIVDKYFEALPGVTKYMDQQKKDGWSQGYIIISKDTGHRFFFSSWDETYHKWISYNWDKYREHKEKDTDEFRDILSAEVSQMARDKAGIQKKSLNYPTQGVGALLMKAAGITFFQYLRDHDLIGKVWIPNIVHDEFLIEVPVDRAEELKEVLREAMAASGVYFCPIINCTADVNTGPLWNH